MKDKDVTRSDAGEWVNLLTWMGYKSNDRVTSQRFLGCRSLTQAELTDLYKGCGIAKRIVDLISDEMTRAWFCVEGDADDLIVQRLEEINAKKKIRELIRWARLYGGALAVVGIDDGLKLERPVNENNIRSIEFIHVFDRHDITFNAMTDLYSDPNHPKYGTPEWYTINTVNGSQRRVHATRTLPLYGETLPNRLMNDNQGWGDSVLQSCYTELRNLGGSYGSTANILQDFIQTILTIDNLSNLIQGGQQDIIKRRLELIDTSRSVSNTILLDAQEEFQKSSSSVAGLDALIDRFGLALASVTGIPYSFLMGQPPSGLQATGQADIRMFYDMVRCQQEDNLQPILERLVRLIMLSKLGPFRGAEPAEWSVKFHPLWQMSENDEALYRKTIAETDAIYLDRGVLDPEEVAISRFGGDAYSAETELDMSVSRVSPMQAQADLEAQQASGNTGNINQGETV